VARILLTKELQFVILGIEKENPKTGGTR